MQFLNLDSLNLKSLQELTEAQLQYIINGISAIAGAASSIGIQYLARKPKIEVKDEHTDQLSNAAVKNVNTALEVNRMLQNLLDKEREHFDQQIAEARKACHQQIEALRENISEEYDSIINKMKEENKAVTDELTKKIIELRAKLSKYENEVNIGKVSGAIDVNSEKTIKQ